MAFGSLVVVGQKNVKVEMGIQYMKDTVTILFNADTVFHSILETNFNGHVTSSFVLIRHREKNFPEFLQIHINQTRVAVSLKDFSKLRKLRIDCLPNPQNWPLKEIRVYKP